MKTFDEVELGSEYASIRLAEQFGIDPDGKNVSRYGHNKRQIEIEQLFIENEIYHLESYVANLFEEMGV